MRLICDRRVLRNSVRFVTVRATYEACSSVYRQRETRVLTVREALRVMAKTQRMLTFIEAGSVNFLATAGGRKGPVEMGRAALKAPAPSLQTTPAAIHVS